jgi:hypothetical protein
MSEVKTKTLEKYLKDALAMGIIDHKLRARINEDGDVMFYIHPDGKDGDTQDYMVEFNELVTLQGAPP